MGVNRPKEEKVTSKKRKFNNFQREDETVN